MALSIGVFALFFLGTLFAWRYLVENNRRLALARFEGVVDDIHALLDSDMRILAGVTAAGAAYVNASENVSRREWAAYVDSLRLTEGHTGISVLGYIEKVVEADLEGFLARTRADGAPDFQIHYHGGETTSPFDDLYPVKYVEPLNAWRSALGFDLGSHPVRRRVIGRAAASGSFTLSDMIQLEWSARPETKFLFMFPVYHPGRDLSGESARRGAIRGLVSSPFPVRGLPDGLPPALRRKAYLQIFNRTDEGKLQLFIDTESSVASSSQAAKSASAERHLAVGGRVWLLRARPTPAFLSENSGASHRAILLLGGVLSLAMGAPVHYSSLSTRRRKLLLSVRKGQLELALKASGVGAWSWDLTAGTVHWSEGTGLLYGLSGRECTRSYESMIGLIHPADRPRMTLSNLSRMAPGSTFEVSYRVIWPDGSEHVLGTRGRILSDRAGQPLCMAGVLWDETAEQRAADALRQSETKYRTLFESSHDAVLIGNQSHFVDCNRTALKMFGCSDKEQFFKLFARDISPVQQPCGGDSANLAAQHIALALRNGSCRFEWTHRRLDSGTSFPTEVILSRMDMGGELLLQGTIRDMSTRVQMQQRIATHEQDLQRLSVALFTAEQRERRVLAAGLHDEVCQSLVLGRLKLKALKQAGDAETANRIAAELDELIKHLLDSCHSLIFNLSTPVLDKLGLQAALEDLCERTQRDHGLPCDFSARGGSRDIPAETAQFLHHSVSELLLNVLKHARATRVRIELRVGKGRVMVAVGDDGIGCPPEAVKRFTDKGGFGLFSICERLHILGGHMRMKPQRPHGTLFVLRIGSRGAAA